MKQANNHLVSTDYGGDVNTPLYLIVLVVLIVASLFVILTWFLYVITQTCTACRQRHVAPLPQNLGLAMINNAANP